MRLTRRHAAAMIPGAAALLAFGARAATPDAIAQALTIFGGGASVEPARVTIDLPEIAENGASVPLAVSVESPMTAADHVAALLILAEGNPEPRVAEFAFTPMSGLAAVKTRIRLGGGPQTVTAVARMSDGTLFSASRRIEVAVAGCIV